MPLTRSQKAQQQESMINTQRSPSPNPSSFPIHIEIVDDSEKPDRFPEWTKYDDEDVSEWEFDGIVYQKIPTDLYMIFLREII